MEITEKPNNWIWQRTPKPIGGMAIPSLNKERQIRPNHIDARTRAEIMLALANGLDMCVTHLSARTRIRAAS